MRGIVHIEDETFITDRNNEGRIPVERVELLPTWDIDRAGSKGQVRVTADAGVLEAGMWLSTYRTITPEQGEIIRYPRGHWHLSRPGIAYPSGHETDSGNVAVRQAASGSDIVDDIAGVLLTEAFYTPVGGNVMQDVRVLIRLATCGILTPIPLANPSFEGSPLWTGWTTGFSGGAGGAFVSAPGSGSIKVPDGRNAFGITFDTRPAGGYGYAFQYASIPVGVTRLMLSGLYLGYATGYRGTMSLQFRDADNNVVAGGAGTNINPGWAVQWHRDMVVADVPDNAVSVRVFVESRVMSAGLIWARPMWDDIRLYAITNTPLPRSRINIPPYIAAASTRIQTDEGKSIGYDAINADRLGAISHNAIATDMDGRLTTQPVRTLANATPRYTFGPGEIELLDVVTPEISSITEKPYNHWRAMKEDFQDAGDSMAADSYNNNPNDPFSVVNSGSVHSAPLITVQDAVDVDALQAMADAARDRYSLSETVRFAIMPITEINVYDVVEIADPEMPEINGVWALNSIDASGDYLVVTATRAVSREV